MRLNLIFNTLDAGPGDEIDAPGRGETTKIHHPLRPGAKIYSRSYWAARHAGGFMHRDAVAYTLVVHELSQSNQERRSIVVVSCLARAHTESNLFGRTFALGADI